MDMEEEIKQRVQIELEKKRPFLVLFDMELVSSIICKLHSILYWHSIKSQ